MARALWVVQGLLALIFLLNGGMKLVLPAEVLTGQFPLPALFVRFIGVCELLGAIGLMLPGLLHIRPGLTPLAASGLVIIMIGATALTLASGAGALALMPLAVGLLATFVAYGRWRLKPLRGSIGPSLAQPAT
jgi:DoxX-like family